MTPPDPTAVREAAERLTRLRPLLDGLSGPKRNGALMGFYETEFLDDAIDAMATDEALLADAYIALTDPTPLTAEVLVGMGFAVKSAKLQTWKRGTLNAMDQDGQFAFATDSMAHIWPRPRTAGELRQLLNRLEK